MKIIQIIKQLQFVFLDFDGVIKESVKVKSDAFEKMFLPFGNKFAKEIRAHHEANGGMSRYDKLPLYLEWVGEDPLSSLVDKYSAKFSDMVKHNVIESEWVLGVLEYLSEQHDKNTFLLNAFKSFRS